MLALCDFDVKDIRLVTRIRHLTHNNMYQHDLYYPYLLHSYITLHMCYLCSYVFDSSFGRAVVSYVLCILHTDIFWGGIAK